MISFTKHHQLEEQPNSMQTRHHQTRHHHHRHHHHNQYVADEPGLFVYASKEEKEAAKKARRQEKKKAAKKARNQTHRAEETAMAAEEQQIRERMNDRVGIAGCVSAGKCTRCSMLSTPRISQSSRGSTPRCFLKRISRQ
jgi:hypothetical protein